MLKDGDVSCAIDFKFIFGYLLLVFVVECGFHATLFNDFIDFKHRMSSIVDDVFNLFGLLLVLMPDSGRGSYT